MKIYALINAQIVSEKDVFPATVLIKDNKIEAVQDSKKTLPKEAEIIDLQGKHILPGLIDAHVHFRTPGMTEKEDWEHASKAALAGGVTTVLDMPNTVPPTVNSQSLEEKRTIIQKVAQVNYGFYAGATVNNVLDVKDLENIAGIKIYMGSSTGNLLLRDEVMLENFMKLSSKMLVIHAEKEDCIQKGIKLYQNLEDPSVHSRIRSKECAAQAVELVLKFAQKHNSRVHFAHVTTKEEVELMAKNKNENISSEVTPHHLFLTEKDYDRYGNLIKVNPPLRALEDQQVLWKGLQNGVIDIIATDHAPHLLEEKMKSYQEVPSGIPGVQTMLPLLLQAVNEEMLTLPKLVELTSFNPAQIFRIHKKGRVEAGFDADLTVVDLNLTERVCHHFLWSKANWSPFHGWILKGWPIMTFLNGELVYEWRDKFIKTEGREVKFEM